MVTMSLPNPLQIVRFAPGGWQITKQATKFGHRMDSKQSFQIQFRISFYQLARCQLLHCRIQVFDLGITQLVDTKYRAFTHQQAHQQGLCRLGSMHKTMAALDVFRLQQVGTGVLYPLQNLMKIMQIVKRRKLGRGHK